MNDWHSLFMLYTALFDIFILVLWPGTRFSVFHTLIVQRTEIFCFVAVDFLVNIIAAAPKI